MRDGAETRPRSPSRDPLLSQNTEGVSLSDLTLSVDRATLICKKRSQALLCPRTVADTNGFKQEA